MIWYNSLALGFTVELSSNELFCWRTLYTMIFITFDKCKIKRLRSDNRGIYGTGPPQQQSTGFQTHYLNASDLND